MKKKVMTIVLLLLVCLTACAQGSWRKSVIEADELKGQEASVAYLFNQPEMGTFVFWGFNEFQFRLISEESQFDVTYSSSSTGIMVHVGLYDENDRLTDKFDMWLDRESSRANRFVRTRDAGGMMNPIGQKGKVKKIFNHLRGGKGYVRIVTERYNNTDFDLKILPFSEE